MSHFNEKEKQKADFIDNMRKRYDWGMIFDKYFSEYLRAGGAVDGSTFHLLHADIDSLLTNHIKKGAEDGGKYSLYCSRSKIHAVVRFHQLLNNHIRDNATASRILAMKTGECLIYGAPDEDIFITKVNA